MVMLFSGCTGTAVHIAGNVVTASCRVKYTFAPGVIVDVACDDVVITIVSYPAITLGIMRSDLCTGTASTRLATAWWGCTDRY